MNKINGIIMIGTNDNDIDAKKVCIRANGLSISLTWLQVAQHVRGPGYPI